jgi:hypothetical protein
MTNPQGGVGFGLTGFGFQNPQSIAATSFVGLDFIITTNGMFFYSGTPALGNLVASFVPPGVTADSFANPVIPDGLTFYGPAGQNVFIGFISGIPQVQWISGFATESATLKSSINTVLEGSGLTELINLGILGPGISTVGARDVIALSLQSNNPGNTAPAQFQVLYQNDAGANSDLLAVGIHGLSLFISALAPTAFSNVAGLFSLAGNLGIVSGLDGVTYFTQRNTLILPSSSTISAGPSTFTVPTAGGVTLQQTVGKGLYRWKAHLVYVGNVGAGASTWGFTGPAAASPSSVQFLNQLIAGGTPSLTASAPSGGPYTTLFNGATLSTTNSQVLDIEGEANFSAAGVLSLQCANTIAADHVIIAQGSWLEVYPCNI